MAPSTTTKTSRTQAWLALAADVALLPSIKVGSASLRKRLRSSSTSTHPREPVVPAPAITSPRPTPQCPRKSALKQPSRDIPIRRASCPCYLTSSSSNTLDIDESTSSDDEKYPVTPDDASPPASPTLKMSPYALLDRVRQIQIFTPSPRRRRVSRVFPHLPPPPDWDEVSITVESDDSDDEVSFSPLTRKVRFVVPASPPPPSPEPELEEPAWCDFM
ncbi:hypothetical protein B0H12DRAFT_753884 [Mycena haematopus]|nr:hypothetical protein B0H12DRAFT_753884 [Mycena haematopus]